MRRLAAVLAAVGAASVLAACGSDEPIRTSEAGGGGEDAVATVAAGGGDAIAAAAANTEAAGSSRLSFTANVSLPTGRAAGSGTISGEGEFDYAHQRGRLTFDVGDLLGGSRLAGSDTTVELLYDDSVVYLGVPLLGRLLPGADEWIRMDLATTSALAGVDLSQLTRQQDPRRYLEYLQAAAAEVDEIGSESVRGVETTHLSATIDLERALTLAPEEDRATIEALIAAGTTAIPIETWIDADGFVRRIDLDYSGGGEGASVTMDFFDFGVDVDVQPPPADQVTDIAELVGSLGALSTS